VGTHQHRDRPRVDPRAAGAGPGDSALAREQPTPEDGEPAAEPTLESIFHTAMSALYGPVLAAHNEEWHWHPCEDEKRHAFTGAVHQITVAGESRNALCGETVCVAEGTAMQWINHHTCWTCYDTAKARMCGRTNDGGVASG
jgi:hypothetical protein